MEKFHGGRGRCGLCVCECDTLLDKKAQLGQLHEWGVVPWVQSAPQLSILHLDRYVTTISNPTLSDLADLVLRDHWVLFKLGICAADIWFYKN